MTFIEESLTAKGYTPAALVPAAFGTRRTIDEIVIHHWGLPGQSHDGVVNFFVNGPGQTSAHYVVSAGRIHCLVSPEDAAWHCPGKNATTIGIECRPEATNEDYATVAELIRTLRARYGHLPLSKHRDWYNTACPGVWDLSRLDALATGSIITTQSETITPLEDTLSAAEVKQITDAINVAFQRTKDELPRDVWAYKNEGIDQRDMRQIVADTEQRSQGTDSTYWKNVAWAIDKINGGVDNLVQRPASDIAAQIDAAGLAAEVRDELVKLIGGK